MPENSAIVKDAQYWITHLGLVPHPEGGFCKELNRGNHIVQGHNGRGRFAYSTIYFMLVPGNVSHFHRLPADEVWVWQAGDAIDVHVLYRNDDDDDLITRDEAGGPRTDSEGLPIGAAFTPSFVQEARRRRRQHDGNSSEEVKTEAYALYKTVRVGPNLENGEILQYTVPAGAIFGSSIAEAEGKSSGKDGETAPSAGFTLVSCVVSPGFDFRDFELFTQDQLMAICPQHEAVIRKLAYEKIPEQ